MLFTPDLCGPITNSEEVFKICWISLTSIDWTVMFACFNTKVMSHFNLFLSSTCLNGKSLLSSDKEFEGTMFSIILKAGSSKNLIDFQLQSQLNFRKAT